MTDFDRLPLPEQRRLVAAELRRIEAGGEPASSMFGICEAIQAKYGRSARIMVAMVILDLYGTVFLDNRPGLSYGNFGPARRALAGRVAGVLEGMD